MLFMALSQAEAVPGLPELALTPMSSGIPNNTYLASQLFKNESTSVSLGMVNIFLQI
jgi:hypothetical protein